jgi:hypothetical protein
MPPYLIMTSTMTGRLSRDQEGTSIMVNGWIWCASLPHLDPVNTLNDSINSADVVHEYRRRIYNAYYSIWITQANHIFNRLGITQALEDYGTFALSTQ